MGIVWLCVCEAVGGVCGLGGCAPYLCVFLYVRIFVVYLRTAVVKCALMVMTLCAGVTGLHLCCRP